MNKNTDAETPRPTFNFSRVSLLQMTMRRNNRSATQNADSKSEIIIPIMGATGAGKSTFINYLLPDGEPICQVGRGLTSCTSELRPITLCFPNDHLLKDYKITLVDTPGFDDTYAQDTAILRRIAHWLTEGLDENRGRKKKVLAGVIYLHDITSKRFNGSARRNLEVFERMCGKAAFGMVIFGTTSWTSITAEQGEAYEKELESTHWSPILERGARSRRFDDSFDSALSFVKDIVRHALLKVYLQIQTEIVDDRKIIPETEAGKELRFTLKEALEMHKKLERGGRGAGGDRVAQNHQDSEAQENLDALIEQIQELRVPFLRKLRKFFGLF
ncbi:hypothetical protein D9613_003447 [Agrocybe pediades]|uniref:G domain-containing protein n=1 Tax=Agrocybe pediades TaxID=84607 RepID=A0A8H4QPN2_9AGAR|nr:hypothetical protein D9613_003447 [Agrocybe pediades]